MPTGVSSAVPRSSSLAESLRILHVVLFKAVYWTLLAGAVSGVGPKLAVWLRAVQP